jgi:hypothetical protein
MKLQKLRGEHNMNLIDLGYRDVTYEDCRNYKRVFKNGDERNPETKTIQIDSSPSNAI